MNLTLIPAYGRNYKTREEIIKAWEEGKDFKIATVAHKDCGRYTSVRDLKEFPGTYVKIRYNKNADFVLVYKDGSYSKPA